VQSTRGLPTRPGWMDQGQGAASLITGFSGSHLPQRHPPLFLLTKYCPSQSVSAISQTFEETACLRAPHTLGNRGAARSRRGILTRDAWGPRGATAQVLSCAHPGCVGGHPFCEKFQGCGARALPPPSLSGWKVARQARGAERGTQLGPLPLPAPPPPIGQRDPQECERPFKGARLLRLASHCPGEPASAGSCSCPCATSDPTPIRPRGAPPPPRLSRTPRPSLRPCRRSRPLRPRPQR
jgi:hypothetical protein